MKKIYEHVERRDRFSARSSLVLPRRTLLPWSESFVVACAMRSTLSDLPNTLLHVIAVIHGQKRVAFCAEQDHMFAAFRRCRLRPFEAERVVGTDDLFIAAHARTLGRRLLTNNTAEFGRVKGVTLENRTLPLRRTRSRGEE